MTVADFNGDGNQDVAVAGFTSTVTILQGNGDGSFQAPTYFVTGSGSYAIIPANLTGNTLPRHALRRAGQQARQDGELKFAAARLSVRHDVPEEALLLDHGGGLRRHQLFPTWVTRPDGRQHSARHDVQLAGIDVADGCDVTVLDEVPV